MAFIKALCVVFLLYSSIDKSQSGGIFSSTKTKTGVDEVNEIAGEIGQMIRAKLLTPENKPISMWILMKLFKLYKIKEPVFCSNYISALNEWR